MSQKELSGRLARWSLKLQAFDFSIVHRKGSEHVVPDALSRAYALDSIDQADIEFTAVNMEDPEFMSQEYKDLIHVVQQNKKILPDITLSDGYLYRRVKFCTGNPFDDDSCWKLWIPQELTEELIAKVHMPPQVAHGGNSKTLSRLKRWYYWPNMAQQVFAFIKNCDICKGTKASNIISRPPMGRQIVVERPFQFIYADILGPYPRSRDGNTAVLVCLDKFSKFPFAYPLRKATSKSIIKFMKSQLFTVFGTPEKVYTDNGAQFQSQIFQDFLKSCGSQALNTPRYCPQSNAAERINRSILAAIRSYIKSHKDWDKYLPEIMSSLRSSIHQAIQMSPFQALFGYDMIQHGSQYNLLRKLKSLPDGHAILPDNMSDKIKLIHEFLKKNLAKAHKEYERSYNLRSRPVTFVKGQDVYKRNVILSDESKNINAKLCPKFIKCKIRQVIGKNRYELEDASGKSLGVYHSQDIRS